MKPVIGNLVAFQVGWWVTALGAAGGREWLGPPTVAALIGIHLVLCADPRRETRLLITVGAMGFVIDSLLIAWGVFRPAGWVPLGWLCPPWLLGLWFLFASILNVSLAWLQPRLVWGALFGAVGGPMAYYAGVQLGALHACESLGIFLGVLAVVWAILVPLLLRVAAGINRSRPNPDRGHGS